MAPLAALGNLFLRALAAQKAVFAHIIVGCTVAHDQSTWASDISLAADAGIDAFALNMGYPDPNIPIQVANAFRAAEASTKPFKLFFSFDYLGGGQPWPATGPNSVASYLNQYKNSPAYYKFEGKPFVSTFEGTANVNDWSPGGPIRSSVGPLYFVPDWTSLGPEGIKSHFDKIEGAFSWDMWPNGPVKKTADTDLAWQRALKTGSNAGSAIAGKTFMMGISPWFFRSASGGANWVWKGDSLWNDRWMQTTQVQPQFVQVVSWNDFGESHYIGPVRSPAEIPAGSADYVLASPHDAFRDFLPFYIARYKQTRYSLPADKLSYWYRTSPVAGGNTGFVVGNNQDHGQVEGSPIPYFEDKVYLSALLTAPADINIFIGMTTTTVKGIAGLNFWGVPFTGKTGTVSFEVVRNGNSITRSVGTDITPRTKLASGNTNFVVWSGNL